MALHYHAGQIDVQTEANTRPVADRLANWVGPVGEFCRTADMIVLAMPGEEGRLTFMAVSGAAPVVDIAGSSTVRIRLDRAEAPHLNGAVACGGIAIDLAAARRARLNGTLRRTANALMLETNEAFTNCRKYIMPSAPLSVERHVGPASREAIMLTDQWLADVVANAETSFLATVSPDGAVDVSHRGGPAGFLRLEPENGILTWDEYVGDGMFKSAGNIRATGRMALLVPELATGDAVELIGHAEIKTLRREKRPRADGLVQHQEQYPVQGLMTCHIETAYRLPSLIQPRRRLEKRRVTSASALHEQAPQ